MKNKKRLSEAVNAAVACAGNISFGERAINRIRFSKQYNAAYEYLEKNYSKAACSQLVKTDRGWSLAVTVSGRYFILYITDDKDGVFHFREYDVKS